MSIKYIVYRGPFDTESMLLLPEHVSHDSLVDRRRVISAGFINIGIEVINNEARLKFNCYGSSRSLKMGSRLEEDNVLARIMFMDVEPFQLKDKEHGQ